MQRENIEYSTNVPSVPYIILTYKDVEGKKILAGEKSTNLSIVPQRMIDRQNESNR